MDDVSILFSDALQAVYGSLSAAQGLSGAELRDTRIARCVTQIYYVLHCVTKDPEAS